MTVQVYYLLGQPEEGEKGLFEGCKKGATLRDYPQEHLVAIRDEKLSFCEIGNNPTSSLFFIRPPLQISTAGDRVLW